MSDLLCPDCGQDHAQQLKHWCDNSDLEIQFYRLKERANSLRSENAKLKEQLAVAVETLGKLSQSGDGSCKDKKASFFDCLPTLQIEFGERKEFAAEALKQIKGMDK